MFLTTFAMTALLAAAPASQPNATDQQTPNSHMTCNRCERMRAAPTSVAKPDHEHSASTDAKATLKPHSPTNGEINAAETGNPDSLDYRNRPDVAIGGDVNAEWQALEAGTPHNPQPGKATMLERHATTPPPSPAVRETNESSKRQCC
jgi:hypothetical protein